MAKKVGADTIIFPYPHGTYEGDVSLINFPANTIVADYDWGTPEDYDEYIVPLI